MKKKPTTVAANACNVAAKTDPVSSTPQPLAIKASFIEKTSSSPLILEDEARLSIAEVLFLEKLFASCEGQLENVSKRISLMVRALLEDYALEIAQRYTYRDSDSATRGAHYLDRSGDGTAGSSNGRSASCVLRFLLPHEQWR